MSVATGDDSCDWARTVRSARDSLDTVSAAALTLIYDRNATQAQVAAQLGLTESQIKTVVADGLRTIAALLFPVSRGLR